MATKYLTGTDFNLAGHYEGGSLPIAGDTVIVIGNGHVVSTGALNLNLAKVYIPESFNLYKFGTPAAPIPISADLIEVYGSIDCAIDCDKLGVASQIDEITVSMLRPSYPCVLTGQSGDAGEWIRMNLFRGTVTVGASVEWAAGSIIKTGYVSNPTDDLRLTVEVMADTLAMYEQRGGTNLIKCHLTEGRIEAGICFKDIEEAGLLTVGPGGTLVYDHDAVSGDSVDLVVASGGFCDTARNGRAKVFTSAVIQPGGRLRKNSLITFTAAPVVMAGGILEG